MAVTLQQNVSAVVQNNAGDAYHEFVVEQPQ
jgi:hypothetical protein